jgi:hypothetical protein
MSNECTQQIPQHLASLIRQPVMLPTMRAILARWEVVAATTPDDPDERAALHEIAHARKAIEEAERVSPGCLARITEGR